MKKIEKINTEAALQAEILLLEMKNAKQEKPLKDEFQATNEKFKPANVVSSILRQTLASPALRKKIMNKATDVALVFLTNLILGRKPNSILKRTISTALVFGVKNIVLRNPDIIRKTGTGIINIITNIITIRTRKRKYTYNTRM